MQRTAQGINAGARLDRLPVGTFHRRILWLIGLGMFLDACDIYIAGGVLGTLVKSGWSDLNANASFLSATFLGMLCGTFAAGWLGDRYGRRFSYQLNLLVFGLASIAAAFAPTMQVLIGIRFVMGIGLGAEIIVGYSSLAEFMPRAKRGRYVALLALVTNMAVPVTGLGGAWLIPLVGWRPMFGIVGVCALVVWVLRKNMPESPRWLESRGRGAEAEALLRSIEAEAAQAGPLPPVPASAVEAPPAPGRYAELAGPGLLRSLLLGTVIACVSGVSLYGFLSWVPTFLVKQGLVDRVARSGSPGSWAWVPRSGALLGSVIADRFGRMRAWPGWACARRCWAWSIPMVGNGVELIAVGFAIDAVRLRHRRGRLRALHPGAVPDPAAAARRVRRGRHQPPDLEPGRLRHRADLRRLRHRRRGRLPKRQHGADGRRRAAVGAGNQQPLAGGDRRRNPDRHAHGAAQQPVLIATLRL